MIKNLPFYGVGPEYSQDLSEDIADRLSELDVFELIPENFFFGRHSWFLEALAKANTPVIIHGIELSIGTDAPFRQQHFDQMKQIADQVNVVAMSDHICMTEAGGTKIGQLTTLPFTERCLEVVCQHIETMKRQVNVPIVMENIANQFYYPNTVYTETEFVNRIMKETGAYLLLDLHNVHANATNFDYDPYEWLREINLDHVWGVHLAGGYFDEGFLEDGHSSAVPNAVWDMLDWLAAKTELPAVIVERTSDYPGLQELWNELDKARNIINRYRMPQKSIDKKTPELRA